MVKILNNNSGMALVVALMTSFLLLALVASLFWVISSTSKQSEYARNSAIALNLAEAGTADAIYRLNYCTGTNSTFDLYPFLGTYIPFDLTSSDTFSVVPDLPELPSAPAGAPYALQGIKRNLGDGYYVVGLLNDATGPDTLISVGVYKGVRRILTVPLRGNNNPNLARHPVTPPVTQGISEAFNKHVIYANKVTTPTPVNVTVSGNIVYANDPSTFPTSGTKTKVDPALFEVCKPDTGISLANFPNSPNPPPHPDDYQIYLYNGYGYDSPWDGANTDTVFWCEPPHTVGAPYKVMGITVSGSGSDYLITDTHLTISYYAQDGKAIKFQGSGNNNGVDAPIGTAGTIINIEIAAGKTFTISGNNTVFKTETALGGIFTINNGVNISGSSSALRVRNASLVIADGLNTTSFINAAVMCDKDITISGAITIDDSTSPDTAAILSFGNPASITVNGAITVTSLPSGQNFILLAYNPDPSGNATISIRNNIVTPTTVPGIIAAYSTAGNGSIDIRDAATIGTSNSGQLIYAYGGGVASPGGITLTSGTVYGSLVTNGTVTLTAGTLNYVSPTFSQTTSANSDIYRFHGGRRAYVPVWQGWRLR
ncbi:MAG: hypothetical protein Q7I94_06215 [Candidatus Contubernalis sp.]|nr:hypothetical protein [Candidatus Contubernalis sp.]